MHLVASISRIAMELSNCANRAWNAGDDQTLLRTLANDAVARPASARPDRPRICPPSRRSPVTDFVRNRSDTYFLLSEQRLAEMAGHVRPFRLVARMPVNSLGQPEQSTHYLGFRISGVTSALAVCGCSNSAPDKRSLP